MTSWQHLYRRNGGIHTIQRTVLQYVVPVKGYFIANHTISAHGGPRPRYTVPRVSALPLSLGAELQQRYKTHHDNGIRPAVVYHLLFLNTLRFLQIFLPKSGCLQNFESTRLTVWFSDSAFIPNSGRNRLLK